MFGLSLGGQLIQGSAERTWNCISQIASLVWYKFNTRRQQIMPRQRRRHHSKSRSRSRSHSHDKDREVKRRKIELFDSPNPKRSVSPEDPTSRKAAPKIIDGGAKTAATEELEPSNSTQKDILKVEPIECEDLIEISDDSDVDSEPANSSPRPSVSGQTSNDAPKSSTPKKCEVSSANKPDNSSEEPTTPTSTAKNNENVETSDNSDDVIMVDLNTTPTTQKLSEEKTPNKRLTPKQVQRRLESEKKRQLKEKEREEREKQKQDEKEKKEAEKLKKKEQKQKEIEQKQKEKEEKEEQKKLEKEQKRKEKEEEKLRKQQELDEKNKEKQKEEEKKQKAEEMKQKAAAAFVNFFVPKKVTEEKKADEKVLAFMPFEVKSDMKLPPPRRKDLTLDEKDSLVKFITNQSNHSFLLDLKSVKPRTSPRTWPCQEIQDDITIIEDDEVLGETICEEKPKTERMRAKSLKFHENQRPAYYGTWRKKSKNITGRRPLGKETIFDYEVDSDDDWEEEEQGENLEVISDEDKENETENDDYEVDNEFFVPHGHLSDDEVDDEENSKLSPESQKQKLKLLKDAFDLDIKSKTHKIKPRSIGCIWYTKNGKNVDEAIDRYLNPLAVITTGQIEIKKRNHENTEETTTIKKWKSQPRKDIPENLMPVLLKLVHGNTIKKQYMVEEFLNYVQTNNAGTEITKAEVLRSILKIAKWEKNSDMKRKYCWMVHADVANKYSVDLVLPNTWKSVEKTAKI